MAIQSKYSSFILVCAFGIAGIAALLFWRHTPAAVDLTTGTYLAPLSKYVPYFDPEFIGLTAADQTHIEAVAKKLGVGVMIQPASDGNYTVDHSAAIFVLNPEGRLAAILTGPFTVDALKSDFQRIVSARSMSAGRA